LFSQKYRENGRLDSVNSVYVPIAKFNKKNSEPSDSGREATFHKPSVTLPLNTLRCELVIIRSAALTYELEELGVLNILFFL